VIVPVIDQTFVLSRGAAGSDGAATPRIPPAAAGRADWHNARAALLMALNDALEAAPDDAAREALIARLAASLEVRTGPKAAGGAASASRAA
jgi:metallo-beta-lactamase family protein